LLTKRREEAMKTRISVAMVGAILLISSLAFSQQSKKAESLYQEALMQMEGKGNFSKALELFGQIIKDYPGNRQVSARSQYQIGVCYEKLGKDEARKAYEQVVKNFADQLQVVADARSRLLALTTVRSGGEQSQKDFKLTKIYTGAYVDCVSPDGKKLTISSPSQVLIRDIESGKEIPLAIELSRTQRQLLWSPDGKMIAYMDKSYNLKVVPSAGGPSKVLATPDTAAAKSADTIIPTGWTSDSKKVILHIPAKGLFTVSASGGELEEILVFQDPAKSKEHEEMTLSPNGKFIAYVSSKSGNKDIYVMSVRGEGAVQITKSPTDDSSPHWSYDGRLISFLSRRTESPEIWIVKISPEGKPEGPEFQISRGGFWGGKWTADGKIGYCTVYRMEHVFTANPDGSQEAQVTHFPAFNGSPRWSPDGKRIIFHSDYGQQLNHSKTWIVPAFGGEAKLLVLGEKAGLLRSYASSPDGKKIGLVSSDERRPTGTIIKLVPAEGGEPKELLSLDKEIGNLDWSPDGKHIMFTYTVTPSTYADADEYMKKRISGISLISSEGGEIRSIIQAEKPGLWISGCSWSPDASQIAYRTFDYSEWEKGGRKEEGFSIWVRDMKTGSSKLIGNSGDGYRLCWSPDGKRIVYEKRVTGMDFDLYSISVEGGNPQKLNIKGTSPVFSPDGKKIAYSRRIGQGYEFWLAENFLTTEK
jgi:Tol biopolymer transport system component